MLKTTDTGRRIEERDGATVDMGPDPRHLAIAREAWQATIEERLAGRTRPSVAHIDFDTRGTAGYLRYRRPITDAIDRFLAERASEHNDDSSDSAAFYRTLGRLIFQYHDDQKSTAFFEARAGLTGLELVLDGIRDCPTLRRHAALYAVTQATGRLGASILEDDERSARDLVLAHLEAEWSYRAFGSGDDELLSLGDEINRTAKGLERACAAAAGAWRRIAATDWRELPTTERDERIRRATIG